MLCIQNTVTRMARAPRMAFPYNICCVSRIPSRAWREHPVWYSHVIYAVYPEYRHAHGASTPYGNICCVSRIPSRAWREHPVWHSHIIYAVYPEYRHAHGASTPYGIPYNIHVCCVSRILVGTKCGDLTPNCSFKNIRGILFGSI